MARQQLFESDTLLMGRETFEIFASSWSARTAADVAQAVAQMKQQPGLNILMYGAGPVAYTLVKVGLVDEIQIWLYPVIAGNGARLFTGASDMPYLLTA